MNSLNFGTAGIPLSTPQPWTTEEGMIQVKRLGLQSMELEFVRNIHVTQENAPIIKEIAKKQNVILTCHGQYYINLNAQEKQTLDASKKRILQACERAHACGVWSICYHAAYYMRVNKEKVYEQVKKSFKEIVQQLKDQGNTIWLRPETGGKVTQFGDLDELIRLSQDVEQVLPCIDFAHHHARTNGKYNTYEEFAYILEQIEKKLGKEAIKNMHMHIEGIEYGEKGEKWHLPLHESDFNYRELLKAIKDFSVKGVITCESPNLEHDALLLQQTYHRFERKRKNS